MKEKRKIRVILADRDGFYLQRLKRCLERRGEMTVLGMTDSGPELLEMAKEIEPDVVLMDIRMPVFDGMTASETIISEDLAGCVVILTAFQDRDLIERANRIGVTGYLVKPVEEKGIISIIERWRREKKKTEKSFVKKYIRLTM